MGKSHSYLLAGKATFSPILTNTHICGFTADLPKSYCPPPFLSIVCGSRNFFFTVFIGVALTAC